MAEGVDRAQGAGQVVVPADNPWMRFLGKDREEQDVRIQNIFDLTKILIVAYCSRKCADEFSVMSLRNPVQIFSSWVMILPWGVCTVLLVKWSFAFLERNDPTEIVPGIKQKWDIWVVPNWEKLLEVLKIKESAAKLLKGATVDKVDENPPTVD